MMKSVPLVVRVLAVAACAMALVSASAEAQQVGGGVKAGITLGDLPNASELLAGDGVDAQKRVGFVAGAFATVRFGNGFAIQPEFLYTQKGVKYAASGGGMNDKVTLQTDFVDVPVLARYTFGKGLRGYVMAGPSFDFKLNAKMKSTGLAGFEEDLSNEVKGFEFGLVFAGGIELGPLLVEARWSEGLTDMVAHPEAGDPSVKTRTFMILGGVRF